MRHDIQVLDRIRKTYASLRPSEQRVADYVLNHPETCTQQTISELADQVQVSQPTVVRFVQALGLGGFRNFKYCLLRDRSQGTEREAYFDHLGGFDLKPWDQLEDLPLKEVRVSGGLLEAALKSLSPQELDRAVRMLATARTIDIYGVENSCTPAGDLLTKLTYLGLCCRMNTDAYLQQIGAAHLGVADVAVAFSHSGCSMDTVKALKLAQKAGAGTIAITSRKNPLLARYADVCLCTGGEEAVIYGTAIFSRIPDLAVVDLRSGAMHRLSEPSLLGSAVQGAEFRHVALRVSDHAKVGAREDCEGRSRWDRRWECSCSRWPRSERPRCCA